jgi:hypothetical protein
MFHWLDDFNQCLPPFFHQSLGLNPAPFFLIFYANLTTRLANGLWRLCLWRDAG